jgi:CRISPR-associated protein Csa3
MRTYITLLGVDSRQVVRPVLGAGLDTGHRVVLLRPETDADRDEDPLEAITDLLTQVVPELDLVAERLPYSGFVESPLSCVHLVEVAAGQTIVLLGGGARELFLSLSVAAFTSPHVVDTVLQVGEVDSTVRRIPQLNLRGTVSEAKATLLADLDGLDTPLSISRIAERLDKSKSTVARDVSRFESEGVVAERSDRSKTVSVTDSGRIFLRTRPLRDR